VFPDGQSSMRVHLYLLPLFCFASALGQTFEESGDGQEEQKAPSTNESPGESRPFDLFTTDRLAGDMWGARSWLEGRGIEFSLGLTSIYQHNTRGGLDTHNGHRISGSADWELTLDFEKMGLVPGGVLYVLAEQSWDDGISPNKVGDLIGVNYDAAGDRSVDVWELWYEQTLLDGKVRLRVGKIDLTSDFDTNAYANDETAQFLNVGLGNTANIPFADRGLGLILTVQPADWLYASLGAVDAQADFRETGFRTAFHGKDYFFGMLEIGLTPVLATGWGKLPGGYRFGMWYDPQPKEEFFEDPDGDETEIPVRRDDVGFYFSMDQLIVKELRDDDADTQGLGLFFRYGFAHEEVNTIEHFWSIGAQYQGLIPTRDKDVIAFGVAQGILSDKMTLLDLNPDRETVYEVYYNVEVFPWLHVTPDVQWITNPGGLGELDNAFVAGLRVQMLF
jgi:carbohydrate-selective porin OprB